MRGTVLAKVINWLRAGYPDGVPVKDYNPLLALLRPTLERDEIVEIVRQLRRDHPAEGPAEDLTVEDIRDRISQIMRVEPSPDEVRQVAAKLAAAGWPLAGFEAMDLPDDDDGVCTTKGGAMDRPQFLDSILTWLRAGYPNGVPGNDYVPLFALLRRQVSEEEARSIASILISEGQLDPDGSLTPISRIDASVLITKVINQLPEEADVQRVRARLEKAGWPFDSAPLRSGGPETT